MKQKKLSICIPTYNREKYLKDLLDSILVQINENNKNKIEICISDNASQDNTEDIVKFYQKISPIPIIYHRNKTNMGCDYNFLKVVEIAKGEYCWLLGSDDIVEKGAIDIILKEIEKEEVDILTFWRKAYTRDLKKEIREVEVPKIVKIQNREDIILENPLEILKYTSNLWLYISVIVIRKEIWLSVKNPEEGIGTYYLHVFMIYSLIKKGVKIKFLNKKLVGWRAGKDSFSVDVNIDPLKRDLVILEIGKKIFGESSKEFDIIKKNFLKKGFIIMAKVKKKKFVYFFKMFKALLPYYYKKIYFWTTFVPLFFIPHRLALFIYKFYKKELIADELVE